jgi:hypothetical protein
VALSSNRSKWIKQGIDALDRLPDAVITSRHTLAT